MDENKIARLQEIIDSSSNIVFFGGAGVSAESGIPDFRSQDGLYHLKYKYPPETIISHSFFVSRPADFYEFYKDKMLALDAEPNPAHRKLAQLEEAFSREDVTKEQVVRILQGYLPNFHHIETGRSLDSKM